MTQHMHYFLRAERGATAIEYGMISALIVIAIIGGVQALGAGVSNMLYTKLVSAFG